MLETPEKVRELQRKLYQKAKQEKGYRRLRIIQKSFNRSMDPNCESH